MSVVSEHMSQDLLTVSAGDRLGEAAKRMVARGVGAVLVMEGDRLEGILTERDLMRAVATGYSDDARVGDWMTRQPETVDASDATDHAASLMIHGGFRHLPVVDRGRVAGIISIRDLMRVALADSSPRGV
ncbi:MAG TPA: CBS domain-containing protein [Gaiellaceae bacterium]|nr:CBS domain-containing protein [Gaiellaceae bacterium]